MEHLKVTPKRRIGEILSEEGLVGVKELEKGLSEQRRNGGRIGEVLLNLHFLSEKALAQSLSRQLGYPYLDLNGVKISSKTLFLVPEFLAKKYLVIPVQLHQRELTVAMVDPLSFEAINDLGFYCGYSVRPVISTKKDICHTIDRYYPEDNVFQEMKEPQDEGLLQTPMEENFEKGYATISCFSKRTRTDPSCGSRFSAISSLAKILMREAIGPCVLLGKTNSFRSRPSKRNRTTRFSLPGSI